MCGITGIYAFNLVGKFNLINITAATSALARRGPDFQDVYTDPWIGLGHRRLSIIDTSEAGNQPMWDSSGRYCIVYNGEIFNYRELRLHLLSRGLAFRSDSDTEVLLQLFMLEKEKCLSRLNGFFSFCIYDKEEQSFFLARDRFGIKPLLYLFDEDKFIFASEMKSMLCYGIEKTLDYNSLHAYLQLNYIPAPNTIFAGVKKLMPGHYLTVKRKEISNQTYYQIPYSSNNIDPTITYDQAKEKFKNLLEASVKKRLVADVPLGAFLSGGIDSSIVTGIASRHKADLQTFSIGFSDAPFFDETRYAKLVARHFNTRHTVFSLTHADLFRHTYDVLDYLDEPFGDSSALAVYILSKEVRKHATVALSGDGADELLAGYNKHEALYRMLHGGLTENLIKWLGPVWRWLPHSRNNALLNVFRQLSRFAEAATMNAQERYWRLATLAEEQEALSLLNTSSQQQWGRQRYGELKAEILKTIPDKENLNDILLTDMQLVLPNDMLTKVDLMSMANSLEVRVPFLDYELVNFVFSLPGSYKISAAGRKRVAQDAFREMLPLKLYSRPKKGFEIPLLRWFRNEMKTLITEDLLSTRFIEEQNIFAYPEVNKLKGQLYSSNPGDSPARIWGLLVFQWWWRKNVGG